MHTLPARRQDSLSRCISQEMDSKPCSPPHPPTLDCQRHTSHWGPWGLLSGGEWHLEGRLKLSKAYVSLGEKRVPNHPEGGTQDAPGEPSRNPCCPAPTGHTLT